MFAKQVINLIFDSNCLALLLGLRETNAELWFVDSVIKVYYGVTDRIKISHLYIGKQCNITKPPCGMKTSIPICSTIVAQMTELGALSSEENRPVGRQPS